MTTTAREDVGREAGSSIAPGNGSRTGTAVSVRDVTKRYGAGPNATVALEGLSLDVAEGEFLCLVGASGCGKSTLLNLVARLDRPTSGTVDVGGRRVAFMFQEATLFPWLTVGANVDLALRLRGVPKKDRKDKVARLLELVRLGGLEKKRPHELSGGMRQRVSLARTLAQEADVVLMDEPFGALDAMTRDTMHEELERICDQLNMTVLFVTHNVREAVRLGDRVVLLSSSPSRVKEEYEVDIPRPRAVDDLHVAERASDLTRALREEVARHVG